MESAFYADSTHSPGIETKAQSDDYFSKSKRTKSRRMEEELSHTFSALPDAIICAVQPDWSRIGEQHNKTSATRGEPALSRLEYWKPDCPRQVGAMLTHENRFDLARE